MNKIDVDKTQNEMLNLISEQNKISTIEDYINNYELKTSLVNIDSMYRNKIPQNIVEMNNVILPTDPLETKQLGVTGLGFYLSSEIGKLTFTSNALYPEITKISLLHYYDGNPLPINIQKGKMIAN